MTASALTASALAARNIGDMALAEQLLRQALEADPNYGEANHFLGLLLKGKGDSVSAEALLRKALAGNDRQPSVHFNLGNLLRGRGAAEEAAGHFRRAIQLNSSFTEAYTQLGESLLAMGDRKAAEAPLREAYRRAPKSAAAVVALADWCAASGHGAEAERLLRGGLQSDPDNIYYLSNLGKLLADGLRFEEAAPLLDKVRAMAPERWEAYVNLGNCLIGLGRPDEATAYFFEAVRLNPASGAAHDSLNKLLWEVGRADDVGKSFLYAKDRLPGNPDLLEMAAESAIMFNRLEEAEEDLAAAAKLRPDTLVQCRLWTSLRMMQYRPDEAIALARAGLRIAPDDHSLQRDLANSCLRAGRLQEALEAARALGRSRPVSQYAVAFETTALRLLGDQAAARRLYDYERFIFPHEMPEIDNAALAQALDAYHNTSFAPIYQSLNHGTQSHATLFTRPGLPAVISGLADKILQGARKFVAGLPDDADHPFLRRKAKDLAWSGSWSVRLRKDGFHSNHIHDEGWISGSYYVQTPDCVADLEKKAGWISFGGFTQQMGPNLAPEHIVQPHPGMMVLFPSYMWHGTTPITGDQPRLTVAFDIVPK
jgi:uncharacterized protein (TIGR02466 family)